MKAVKQIFASLLIMLGIAIIVIYGLVFSLMNSAMTQTQVFLQNWQYYILGVVLAFIGLWWLERQNKRDKMRS